MTVHKKVIAGLVQCPDCKGWWLGGWPHAPHWRDGVLVDCSGRAVAP